jgi:pimeloyl-ACP methyl ester carboxylesterase
VTSLFFTRRGSGPPLVLLHGIGHHWRAWEPVLDRLAAHHDVIAVDLPGFGRSSLSGDFAGMPSLVAALASFFTDLGLVRPHVAGNSLGGALALELAAAGHVASATALSPAGFASPAQLRYAVLVLTAHRLVSRLPTPVVRTLLRSSRVRAFSFGMLLSRPGRINLERALADTAALRSGAAFRAVARASRGYAFSSAPTVPVTVGWGTNDLILRHRQAAVARRGLPQARHVDLTGCGHVPMSDDPDLVADLILATTGALPPSSGGL